MDTNDGSFRRHLAEGIYRCYYKRECPYKINADKKVYCTQEVCELEENELERICLQYGK